MLTFLHLDKKINSKEIESVFSQLDLTLNAFMVFTD